MTHCSDDDLVLHYYGEPGADETHLASCAACTSRFRELASLLGAVTIEVPERGDDYESRLWERIRPAIAPRRVSPAIRWTLAAAATVTLVAGGYFAGRLSQGPAPATPSAATAPQPADDDAPRRVLLMSVADHLERSDRVLTDIMNAPGGQDLTAEQQWAEDLIAANRLYRQDAEDSNESSIATVLDELERALLDIVHRPSTARARDLEEIRQRIDSAALLFKVRVMSNDLRRRQLERPAAPAPRHPSPIG